MFFGQTPVTNLPKPHPFSSRYHETFQFSEWRKKSPDIYSPHRSTPNPWADCAKRRQDNLFIFRHVRSSRPRVIGDRKWKFSPHAASAAHGGTPGSPVTSRPARSLLDADGAAAASNAETRPWANCDAMG
ncbi:hypothetical protein Zmor_012843 [Zophobas morio]|uniref:Uncharacterized protein n=1 Tax=Zophobas morio TaxID=2755281 RepID=A0AA38MEP8_9CUCU|nr:hypothetical protein Zmor_012843 [Zophobas morio]